MHPQSWWHSCSGRKPYYLPAGLPLTSFITPDGKLYLGDGYLPAQHKGGKSSFREIADEALARFPDKQKIDQQSFQLEIGK
jgi:uncharacterized protein YyaL (SSP411 family)